MKKAVLVLIGIFLISGCGGASNKQNTEPETEPPVVTESEPKTETEHETEAPAIPEVSASTSGGYQVEVSASTSGGYQVEASASTSGGYKVENEHEKEASVMTKTAVSIPAGYKIITKDHATGEKSGVETIALGTDGTVVSCKRKKPNPETVTYEYLTEGGKEKRGVDYLTALHMNGDYWRGGIGTIGSYLVDANCFSLNYNDRPLLKKEGNLEYEYGNKGLERCLTVMDGSPSWITANYSKKKRRCKEEYTWDLINTAEVSPEGNLVYAARHYSDQTNSEDEEWENTFDEENRLVSSVYSVNSSYSGGEAVYRNDYQYDENGLLTEIQQYLNDSGDARLHVFLKYNDEGQILEEYNVAGDVENTVSYQYDEQGKLTFVTLNEQPRYELDYTEDGKLERIVQHYIDTDSSGRYEEGFDEFDGTYYYDGVGRVMEQYTGLSRTDVYYFWYEFLNGLETEISFEY